MLKSTFTQDRANFLFQQKVAIAGIVLFLGKLLAWKITNSDAVFSDAMESIVNIIAAFMGLYSLHLASKPRDTEHPYGHGKAEFVTSGIEGALIIFAGIMIMIQSVNSRLNGNQLEELDYGILIIAATAVVNFSIGYISYRKGVKNNSLVLQSSGKHLQSDTITTFGVVVSLVIVYFTHWDWLDSATAVIFGLYIIFVGYKIIRKALAGIMDEADPEMLTKLASFLERERKPMWIDVHNTKIQQHGSSLHIDAHLTLPWYLVLRDAHNEMEELLLLIAKKSERKIEFNFHMDDCKPISCDICEIIDCPVRQHSFKQRIVWDKKNIAQVQKHSIKNATP